MALPVFRDGGGDDSNLDASSPRVAVNLSAISDGDQDMSSTTVTADATADEIQGNFYCFIIF